MNKAELLALINEVDDNADIDEIILGNGFAKPITDVEGLNSLLASNKELQGLFDKKVTVPKEPKPDGSYHKQDLDYEVRKKN